MKDQGSFRASPSISTCDVARPEPYQPATGTEGADFMAVFCDRCQHDAAYQAGTGDSCEIVANTMVFSVEDEAYPKEWIYGPNGEPTCTAFARQAAPLDEREGT